MARKRRMNSGARGPDRPGRRAARTTAAPAGDLLFGRRALSEVLRAAPERIDAIYAAGGAGAKSKGFDEIISQARSCGVRVVPAASAGGGDTPAPPPSS